MDRAREKMEGEEGGESSSILLLSREKKYREEVLTSMLIERRGIDKYADHTTAAATA